MPKRLSLVPRTTAYPTIDPLALTNVEDALAALQKAFRARNETPKQEHADTDDIPQQPSQDDASQT